MLANYQHLFNISAINLGLRLGSLQIIITLTVGVKFTFLQSGVKILLACPGIEPTMFDLSSQSGAFDGAMSFSEQVFPQCSFPKHIFPSKKLWVMLC